MEHRNPVKMSLIPVASQDPCGAGPWPAAGSQPASRSVLILTLLTATLALAQPPAANPLGDGPWTYKTAERNTNIKVSVVTKGLSHPWALAFLPNGDTLITERNLKDVRLVHNGVLDPKPLPGLESLNIDQLFDIALHPNFAQNQWVYLTYIKKGTPPNGERYWASTALARGRFTGTALADVKDVFVADAWQPLSGGDGSRVTFAPDGKLFFSSSHRRNPDLPQDPSSDVGKILRLNDDGSIPQDNPFVGRAGYKPEIYSIGHRTILGLTIHPQTGALWETENGPQGGDEVNIIKPGLNYGWPVVTYGRDYDGEKASPTPWRDDMEPPELFWVPSVTASGIAFYTGDKIPGLEGKPVPRRDDRRPHRRHRQPATRGVQRERRAEARDASVGPAPAHPRRPQRT